MDGQLAFPMVASDADQAIGQSLDDAARQAAQALEEAVAATREARDRTRLFWSALWNGVATLVFLLLVGVALRARRWVAGGPTSVIRKRALGFRVAGYEFLPPQRQLAWTRFLVSLVTWVVLVLVTYEWLSFSLNQFTYTRPWGGSSRASCSG